MKLSLMIEEANKISADLRKNTVFSRYTNSGLSDINIQQILLCRNVFPQWLLYLKFNRVLEIQLQYYHFKLFCCRHDSSDDGTLGQGDVKQVRVQNTKLGISTFWTLDKFQDNMAAMRELDQVRFTLVFVLNQK